MVERPVTVDGVLKGHTFKKGRRWYWRRNSGAVEPVGPSVTDVLHWALFCCRGKTATARGTTITTGVT